MLRRRRQQQQQKAITIYGVSSRMVSQQLI